MDKQTLKTLTKLTKVATKMAQATGNRVAAIEKRQNGQFILQLISTQQWDHVIRIARGMGL